MIIKTLSTGSKGNCILVRDNDNDPWIMLDCGITQSEMKRHLASYKIEKCYISHSHGDHCQCVPLLNNLAVTIVASPQTLDVLKLQKEYSPFIVSHRFKQLIHDSKDKTSLIWFYVGGKKLVYATDTGYLPPVDCHTLILEINHTDLEIQNEREGLRDRIRKNHMSLSRAIEDLKGCRFEELYVSHMSDRNANEKYIRQQLINEFGHRAKIFIL